MPPKYAPDLLDYAERLGQDDKPYRALQEPDFKRRALSREAPTALVYRVANAVEDIDSDPTVQSLSNFERARILFALGRTEEAYELYKMAYEESDDSEIGGLSLLGMSNTAHGFKERERLIKQAIDDEGYLDGYVYWAALYSNEKQFDKAIEILKTGIGEGNVLCVGMLAYVYVSVCERNPAELEGYLMDMVKFAKAAGIENWWDEPFRQFNQQFFAKTKDGKVVNFLAVMEPLRRAFDFIYNQREEGTGDPSPDVEPTVGTGCESKEIH